MPFTLESDSKRRRVEYLTRSEADALYLSKDSTIVATKTYVTNEIEKVDNDGDDLRWTEAEILDIVKTDGFIKSDEVSDAIVPYAKTVHVDAILTSYAKTTDLSGFVTSDAITTALEPYAKTADVNTKLADYATTSWAMTELGFYATIEDLRAYAKTADVDLKFGEYATISSVDKKLEDYVKGSVLADYATISSVNKKLEDYAKASVLDDYATKLSLASYATKLSLGDYATKLTLDSYATTSSLSIYQKTADAITKVNVLTYVDEAGYAKRSELPTTDMTTASIDKLFLTCSSAGTWATSATLGAIPYTVQYIGTSKELTAVPAPICYHGKLDRQFIFNACNSLVDKGIEVPAGMWSFTLNFNIVKTNDNWLKFSQGRVSLCLAPPDTVYYQLSSTTSAIYNGGAVVAGQDSVSPGEPALVGANTLTVPYGPNATVTDFYDSRFAAAPCRLFLDQAIDLTNIYGVHKTFYFSIKKPMVIYPCLHLVSNNASSPSKETNAFTGRRYPATHYPFTWRLDDGNGITAKISAAELAIIRKPVVPPYNELKYAEAGVGPGGRAFKIKQNPMDPSKFMVKYYTHLSLSVEEYSTVNISSPAYMPMCQLVLPHTSTPTPVAERADDMFISMTTNNTGQWFLNRIA